MFEILVHPLFLTNLALKIKVLSSPYFWTFDSRLNPPPHPEEMEAQTTGLMRCDTGRLAIDVFTSNPIVSSKE